MNDSKNQISQSHTKQNQDFGLDQNADDFLKKIIQQQSRFQKVNYGKNSQGNQFLVKESPNIAQYLNDFVRNRKPQPLQFYSNNFQAYGIKVMSDLISPLPIRVQQIFKSKNNRIIHYLVRISYFFVKVKIFNTIESDNYKLQFSNQISHGMFGTVYQIRNPIVKSEEIAIKQIPFNSYPFRVIEDAVKEYGLVKILAALEIGPQLVRIFGFDMVVSSNSIMFSMEKGEVLNTWIMQNLNKEKVNEQFDRLEESLLQMHSLNICHNDIKPANIIYSHTLKKLVYIDFGFTQVKTERLGYMGMCLAKGSLYYCSQQMKNIFLTTGQGFVDTYYNDYICLKKSKQFILRNFLYNDQINKNDHLPNQPHCLKQDGENSSSQIDCFAEIMTIYLAHIIEKVDIDKFTAFINEKSWAVPLIQQNMKKICLFFIQMDASLGLWKIFVKFCDVFISENLLLNPEIKKLIQVTIKPYFKSFLQISLSNHNNYDNNFQDDDLQTKILKRYNKFDTTLFKNGEYPHEEECGDELDLQEESDQRLQNHFLKMQNLKYYQQKQIFQLLMNVFNFRKWYLISESDIILLKRSFFIAGIRVSHKNLRDKSTKGIFIAYLILVGRFICFMHNSFNFKIIISQSIRHYYGQAKQLKEIINWLALDKQSQQNECQSNHLELFQLYVLLGERMLSAYEKNLNYQLNLQFLKRYMKIFMDKIGSCLSIKQKFLQDKRLEMLVSLIDLVLEKYVIFCYQAGMHGYIRSFYQADHANYYYFHGTLIYLCKNNSLEDSCSSISKIIRSNQTIKYLNWFINLMTFSDLIPVTFIRKYQLIQNIQDFIKVIEQNGQSVNIDNIQSLRFNSKLKLFFFFVNERRIIEAVELGNLLVQGNLITSNQQNIFIVQTLFRRLNNSKKVSIMNKKLENFKFDDIICIEQNLVVENALLILENQAKKVETIGSQLETKNVFIEKIKMAWTKCLESPNYKNRFTSKLFMLRSLLTKLIKNRSEIKAFVLDYEQQMVKYQNYLLQKIKTAKSLNIYLHNLQSTVQSPRKEEFLCDQHLTEFLMIQWQHFMKILLNGHNIIQQEGLIENCWANYLRFNQEKSTPNTLISDFSKQTHLQLTCKYHQYLYRQCFLAMKSQNNHLQPKQLIYLRENEQKPIKTLLPLSKISLYESKINLESSVKNYILSYDKTIMDHEFYFNILIALKHKSMKLKGYTEERVRSELKSYFYFMIQSKQIFFFFYFYSLPRKFLSEIIHTSSEELITLISQKPAISNSKDSKSILNIWDEQKKLNERFLCFRPIQQNLKNQNHFLTRPFFIQDVFESLCEFTKDNQCQSYQNFIIELSFESKATLIKVILNHSHSRGQSPALMIEKVLEELSIYLTRIFYEKNLPGCIVLLLILMTLKIDYAIKIQHEQILSLSLKMKKLESVYKIIGNQVLMLLCSEYWLNKSKKQLKTTNQKSNSKASQFKINRKLKYYTTQFIRSYVQKNLITNEDRYLDSVIKRLKRQIISPKQTSIAGIYMNKKIQSCISCNRGQGYFL